ncbi:hypothetical protein SUSAZ_03350 [Sulfolobus acidocaldarius SUSAZ]|nr:hypothetical protein SUSAZ_03350 [Sulfolobus acidocaldarius SUSAZ]
MNKAFIVVTVVLLILGIISFNLVFIILAIVSLFFVDPQIMRKFYKFFLGSNISKIFVKNHKTNQSIVIEDGYLKIEDKVKAFLIVDDIPFDYRDLSDESLRVKISSFHKVLDIAGQIDIVFRKSSVDKNKFLSDLFQKAQNIRVIIDADPSNERAKNELMMIQHMIKKISEGEMPFKYLIFFIINSDSKEKALATADVVKKGLEGIGVKSRLAYKHEIEDLLNDKLSLKKIVFPSQIPFLSVFSLQKQPDYEIITDGIYLGQEINDRRAVFWNINRVINPHALIIGPTGSGKTEFLLSLGVKTNILYNIPIVFFDVKKDISLRLKKYGYKYKYINPLLNSINLLKFSNVNKDIYLIQLENIIRNSFKLDRFVSALLYRILLESISDNYYEVSWDYIIDKIEKYDINEDVKAYLLRIVSAIKSLDAGLEDIDLISAISEGINVVDLSSIKSEELRRLVMYSIIIKFINKYNIADDRLKLVLVIDEAWTLLRSEDRDYQIVADLIKRGRGFGIGIFMATQNFDDLGELSDVFLENIGLLAFMNNGDKKFWNEVMRFADLNIEESLRSLIFLGKGEMLIRFINDPRPIMIKTDVLVRNSF